MQDMGSRGQLACLSSSFCARLALTCTSLAVIAVQQAQQGSLAIRRPFRVRIYTLGMRDLMYDHGCAKDSQLLQKLIRSFIVLESALPGREIEPVKTIGEVQTLQVKPRTSSLVDLSRTLAGLRSPLITPKEWR